MEWSFKKKQEVENLVKQATENVNNLALDAANLPIDDVERKKTHQENVINLLTNTVATLNTLQDTIILLGQSFQAQQEAILKTTIAMVGEEQPKPEPIQQKKPFTPRNGRKFGVILIVYLVLLAGYYIGLAVTNHAFDITLWKESSRTDFGVLTIVSMFYFIVMSMVFWEDVPPTDDRSKT